MLFVRAIIILLLLVSIEIPAALSSEPKTEAPAPSLKTGKLYIYGAVGQKIADPLIKEFQTLYPEIRVDFVHMSPGEVFNRHMNNIAAGRVSADILWSPEITLQSSLVKDGYSLRYRPQVTGSFLPFARKLDTSLVTAFEPIVMAYNRKFFSRDDYPTTHRMMQKEFRDKRYRGMIGTCDPDKNTHAFMLLTQDLVYGFNFWTLVKSFGEAGIKLFPDYSSTLSAISSGEIAFAYNIPLSEIAKYRGAEENIGWFYPSDYTLALPLMALISRGATNPDAAKLWADFLFSKAAQQTISWETNLLPVREDVEGGELRKIAKAVPGGEVLKAVGTDGEASRYSDKGLKRGFLLKWKQLLNKSK